MISPPLPHFLEVDRHIFRIMEYGNGANAIIFFHGVNQNARSFESLFFAFPEYKIYSVDLPFHGQTQYNSELLKPVDLKHFFEKFFQKFGLESIVLSGYSMGGKIALKSLEVIKSDRIKGLVLFAPDGISENTFYKLATGNIISKKIFSFLMNRSKMLIFLAKILKEIRLLPPPQFKLLTQALSHPKYIQKVKSIWIATAPCNIYPQSTAEYINTIKCPTYIFVGVKDAVIPFYKIKAFYDKIDVPTKGFFEFDFGHNFTHPSAISALKNTIKENFPLL